MHICNLRNTFIILLLILSVFTVHAQDTIVPLQYNPLLDTYIHNQENTSGAPKKRSKHDGEPHTQYLPFFDDFSTTTWIFPNDTLWLDKKVYISNTAGKNPPSIGVAVFDGLNASGKAYDPGNQSTGSTSTDTLTSTYIDLSNFSPLDTTIYLSFAYQPSGLGDAPEVGDSLILQFHPDSLMINGQWDDSAWVRIWAVAGSSLQPFQQVMIPIRKLSTLNYFHNKFQFRFIARGHRSGNLDNWLLDYVYINRGRTKTRIGENDVDVLVQDVASYKTSGSILNKYYAVTLKQFLAGTTTLVNEIPIYATNNSNVVKNTTYGYNIVNAETGQTVETFFNTQGDNVNSFEHRPFNLPNKLTASKLTDPKTTLLINTVVESVPDRFRQNDTATHKQVFGDYLAYDDGTAEGGYGLVGANIGKVAMRFTINAPDTLHGIAVHFNQADAFVGGRFINLAVWQNLTPLGQPEKDEPAAKITFVKPTYENINGYTYFEFKTPVPVKDQFYIGWVQNQDFVLNVGFDKNYEELQGPKTDNLMISTTGKWEKSTVNGIPMMRPYIGSNPVFVGGNEVIKPLQQVLNVNIYPNPNKGNFIVSLHENGDYEITVYDIAGKPVSQTVYSRQSTNLTLENIKAGIYLVKVVEKNSGRQLVKRISVL
ncbi:MAG: T9SS type A sorting domain-containing protein [Bacteroidia bacterium]